MSIEQLALTAPEVAQAWADHWTRWLKEEGEPITDAKHPWLDVFGDDPIEFIAMRGGLWRAHRDPTHGYDSVDWIWDGEGWYNLNDD